MICTERKHFKEEVGHPYVGHMVQSAIVTQQHFATTLGIGKSKPVWVGGGANRWANKESLRRERRAERERKSEVLLNIWDFKSPKTRLWFYPLWWKHGVRCDVKTLHGVRGPFGPSVPEAPEVQPASRSRRYSFPAEVQPETADGQSCEPGVPSAHERRTQANSRWGGTDYSGFIRPVYRLGSGLASLSTAEVRMHSYQTFSALQQPLL